MKEFVIMGYINSPISFGREDVFHASLVYNAEFIGTYEFPRFEGTNIIPNKLIPFNKALLSKNHNMWIHFYIHDYEFERIWNSPKKYLPIINRFNGVISPDFSLYRDMPLAMQIWNTYRNRAIALWLENNGTQVVPNVRWSDKRSYEFCFEGFKKNSIIAISTHGCIKKRDDKSYFINGLDELMNRLTPKVLIVHGSAPDYIFNNYKNSEIKIIQFNSLFNNSRKQVNA